MKRLLRHFGLASALVAVSLGIGIIGYHTLGGFIRGFFAQCLDDIGWYGASEPSLK